MVTTVANFGRSGLADWMIQRFSALLLLAYTVFIVVFLFTTPDLDYGTWHNLFDQLWVKVFTLLAILSVAAHGWIGLWAVLTDYVTERLMGAKALALRIMVLVPYAIITLAYVVWGIDILWG